MSYEALERLKGSVQTPDQEVFKIGPEVIEDFISKVLVVMGAKPDDIKNIEVTNDKKRLKIFAMLEKDSRIFSNNCDDENKKPNVIMNMAIFSQGEQDEDYDLSEQAQKTLIELGYSYKDEDDRLTSLVSINEYKKGIELEFNADVTMAIITDTDFSDEYFVVDAFEEPVQKKKYNSHKFKGKKKVITFAKVYRSYKGDKQGFHPSQVVDWRTGVAEDDEEDC